MIKCGGCGKNLQLHITKKKRKDGSERITSKIRCLSRIDSPACKGYVFIPVEEITGPVTRMILSAIGDKPVTKRVYIQGKETTERLAAVEASINYHVAQLLPGGIYDSEALRAKGEKALAGLRSEVEQLQALGENGQDRWEYVETGMTFAEQWQGKDPGSVTNDLVQAGITVECHPEERGGHVLRLPEDLRRRIAGAPGRPQHRVATVPPTRPSTTATTLST
ncbi:Integrase OS=Streptomyces microflavus OX=1919 GN=Smic_20260 PE=4 SV=1 [Streptomyces microflavus]